MSEKKLVRRSVAIALGIMCIILVGGLAGVLAYYIPMTNDKNNTISSLNYQNNQLKTNNTLLQSQVRDLTSQVTKLQDQINNLHIAGAGNSTIWANNETRLGSYFDSAKLAWGGSAPSAGYLSVRVSSKENTTYVEVQELLIANSTYTQNNPLYHIDVGLGGTAVFPILPAQFIWIIIGNTTDPTVTITYYY
jgi:hypothetical protein